MDIYPTIVEMTGVGEGDSQIDGVSLVPLLRQSGELAERSLFWHYPHYQHYQQEGTTPYGAIRRGDWRLVAFYDDHRVELYNLKDDPGERTNLASSAPDLVKSMQDELHAWLRSVNAQMPTPNPNYDPTIPEHTPPAKKQAATIQHAPFQICSIVFAEDGVALNNHGFTDFYGYLNHGAAHDYFNKWMWQTSGAPQGVSTAINNGGPVDTAQYTHDLIAARSEQYVAAHASGDAPFYMQVAYTIPHSTSTPFPAPRAVMARTAIAHYDHHQKGTFVPRPDMGVQ